ncbi:DNA helicase [Mycobacterium phage Aikoy]|uniref:DNA helicase n=1 Tax=Mycobacterium phage Onyinye TaxID=2686235 RepID=A0A6B9L7H5_9CAUD|nr:DNA helicase [Mycobacterium phage Onyinye]QHB37470.1 DNA helicase [Mycobacterium phage Onyinye]WKW85227.1 DNA helicase [Mycobacterium phage Aikoy]
MAKKIWAMGLNDGKIWIMTDGYDPDVNDDLKSRLPGPPRWNGKLRRWQFPVKWETCTGAREIANKYGAELRLSAALSDWAWEEKARIDSIPDVQSMDLVELPKVQDEAPAIWKAMQDRPFQTVGAAFAARNRSCLIADQPGLGKTVQTIGAVIESGIRGPILVVAPKAAAQLTWPQELKRWAPGDSVFVIGDNMKPAERKLLVGNMVRNQGLTPMGRTWIITSPYYLRIRAETDEYNNYVYKDGKKVINPVGSALVELLDIEWAGVVVDESHQTLAGATGNKKKQSAQRLGLGALKIREDGLRIALSGTPFRGQESYLWGQLNWLRPDMFRSYRRWVEQHFDTWFDGFGWQVGLVKDRAAMYEEAKNVMIRRTKEEVAKDLPPKQYGGWPLDDSPESPVAVWLDMAPKQAKAYADMLKLAEVELDGGTLMTTGILAELTRLKQFAGSYGKVELDKNGDSVFVPTLPSNKFDWLVEFLDERGIAKSLEKTAPKVVVVSQFKQLVDCFAEALAGLGIKTHRFTGDTPQAKREAIKDDWQNNPESDTRVLLLTTTAGGVSLTLDAADDMVILDETWNPADQEQVEDRLHRLSRMHQVTIWKVFSRNTIEEGIARNNLNKEASIKGIIDGERGIEFLKHVAMGKSA